MTRASFIAVAGCRMLGACAAHGPGDPAKPLGLVLGSGPGGGSVLAGRIVAQKMSENLGQQVIVDNRGGANGIIGMDVVAKAAPDGYTFYMGTAGHISVNSAIRKTLPFNVDRDFAPLTQVVSLPFKSLGELIAHAKAKPGELAWSSSGDGGLPHLSGELIRLTSGIDTRRIPYKGSAPAFNDLLGGRVNYCIEAVSIGLAHVKAGRLVALATTAPRRLTILPEVPAVSETLPRVEVLNWYGALLPGGASKTIVGRLHGEMVKAMHAPDVRARLAGHGFDVSGSSPEAFGAFRRAEQARWAAVIRDAGIERQ